jgi:hypothetical protein
MTNSASKKMGSRMTNLSRIIVGVVLLAVMLVFVAPAVDLAPTALRSAKAALNFFAAIACLIILPYAASSSSLRASSFDVLIPGQASNNVLDLICSRLC